MFGSSKVI